MEAGGEELTTVNGHEHTENHHERAVGAKDDSSVGEEGHILEVYAVPLLGLQKDNFITMKDVSPDVVFPQPPNPKSAQPTTVYGAGPPRYFTANHLVISYFTLSVGTAFAAVGVSAAAWLARQARLRRRAFAHNLLQLEADLQASCVDPARDSRILEGSLERREREAAQLVLTLEDFFLGVTKASKRCPWEARGESSRRLATCLRKLSGGLTRAELAVEELRVMREIEQLLHEIDGLRGRKGQDEETSSDGEGVGAGEIGEIGGSSTEGEGGSNGTIRAHRRARLQKKTHYTRLSTRANALLMARSASIDGQVTSAARCVFRSELKVWCDALAAKEQQAVDRLKLGLRKWDLDMVDAALSHLRLLELPGLVEGFREKREDVRGKLWSLREELRGAISETQRGGFKSRLRQACVKAEMFSATAWPEYKAATLSLERAHDEELEVQARRIKAVHGMSPDTRLKLCLDSNESRQTRSHTNILAPESDDRVPGVDRRLFLKDSVGAGIQCAGESGDRTIAGVNASKATSEFFTRGCTASGAYGRTSAVAVRNDSDEMQQQAQNLQTLTVRRSAESHFLAYVTEWEEANRRAWDADRKDLERREDKDVYRQEYMARLDARKDQEDRRLIIEEERLRTEEEERRKEREDRDRRRGEDRLAGLWSRDGDFLRLLAVIDVAVATVTIALKRGFTLVPRMVLKSAWALVVAECSAEDDTDSASSTLMFSPPAASERSSFCPTVAGAITGSAGGLDSTQVCRAGDDDSESFMWWAWSTVGSAAGAVVRASYSSAGWVLGQTLGLMTPGVQCEMRVVISLGAWFLSLVLALKVIGLAGGDGQGPAAAATRLVVVIAWVWGRFHGWVLAASRELLLAVAPVPFLLVVYGLALRYVERHLKPDGFWWMNGWDVRPFVSRVVPAVVSLILAWFLGSLSV